MEDQNQQLRYLEEKTRRLTRRCAEYSRLTTTLTQALRIAEEALENFMHGGQDDGTLGVVRQALATATGAEPMPSERQQAYIEKTKSKIEVMEASTKGDPIEYRAYGSADNSWQIVDRPAWDWINYQYRIALVDDYIDWSHVHSDYKFMARDENGLVWLYDQKPQAYSGGWRALNMPAIPASHFASLKVGNKAWLHSLVERPG